MLRHRHMISSLYQKGGNEMKGQLTKRDITLIEHCRKHLPITSDMAAILFYPNRYIAQRRLNTIHQLKQLKRTERIVVNQPYIYYLDKRDIRHLPFTKLLYDIRQNQFEISEYEFDGQNLVAIIHKDELSYKINTTIKNLEQVYKRLSLVS